MNLKSFVIATRVPFVAASLLVVLFSTAYVKGAGIDYFLFSLVIIAVFSLHLAANTINDFFDWDNDGINKYGTKFNGGSRHLVEAFMGRKKFKRVFIISLLIGVASILLISYFRAYAIILGVVGVLIAYYYSGPPLSLQTRGLGEFVVFLAFGPVLTFGTGYVLTGTLSLDYFLIGIPSGLLTALILWINEFPDYESDKKTGKKNGVVRLGLEKSFNIFMLGHILVYASITLLIIAGILPTIAFSLFIFIPLSFLILKQAKPNLNNPPLLEPVQGKSVMLQNLSLIAMTILVFFY